MTFGPLRLLVVDDTLESLEAIARRARGEGFDVQTAADGPTALQLACEDPPDIALVDVVMHPMDGLELCRRLRASEATRNALIILCSDLRVTGTDRRRGLEAGADGYIRRPVSAAEFSAELRAFGRLLERLTDKGRTHMVTRLHELAPELTAREVEVAARVADGASTSEIATALSISPNTVNTHRNRVRAKLGIDGREPLKRALLRLSSTPPESRDPQPLSPTCSPGPSEAE